MNLVDFLTRVSLDGVHNDFEIVNTHEKSFSYGRTADTLMGVFAEISNPLFDTRDHSVPVRVPIYNSGKLIQMSNLVGTNPTTNLTFTGDIPTSVDIKGDKAKSRFMLASTSVFPEKISTVKYPPGIIPTVSVTNDALQKVKTACTILGEYSFYVIIEKGKLIFRVGTDVSSRFEVLVASGLDSQISYNALFKIAPVISVAKANSLQTVNLIITEKALLISVEDVLTPSETFSCTYLIFSFHKTR